MPVVGYDVEYTDTVEFTSGTGTDSQFGIAVTMPEDGYVTHIGAWIRGYSVDTDYRLYVWGSGGSRRCWTALETVDAAAVSVNAMQRKRHVVTAEEFIAGGTDLYVGVSREDSGGLQITRHSSGTHYERNASSIASDFTPRTTHSAGRMGFWFEYDVALPDIKVYRSGVWTAPTDIVVRRSGAWVTIGDEGYVRRGAAWTKA